MRRHGWFAILILVIAIGGCGRTQAPGMASASPEPTRTESAPEPAPAPAAASHDPRRPIVIRSEHLDAHGTTMTREGGAAERGIGVEVIAAEESPTGRPGEVRRLRLLRRDGTRYPLVRREEVLVRDAGGERRLTMREMVADHLMVSVPRDDARRELRRVLPAGCRVREAIPGAPLVLVEIPAAAHADFPAAQAAIAAIPGVTAAEPDWLVRASVTPSDPRFAEQWALHNAGQTGGAVDADIDAPEAWQLATGSRAVRVGVIDTGIDLEHPQLQPNLWTNPGEIPANGIDDDGNGYIDDVRGWNFYAGTANPDDDHFHGTHVAGTIGALGDDGVGVAGVCWRVTLVPLKFLGPDGGGYISGAVGAVYYANAIGCDLTNNSWGGGGYSQALKDAIDAAGAQGRLFVAAAGNAGIDLDLTPDYPAAYPCANIIAVAATDHADLLAGFSNHGDPAVHLAAPGVAILSTLPMEQTTEMWYGGLSTQYGSISGTSMAAPHVSGAVALLKAAHPGLSAAELRSRVILRSDTVSSLVGRVAGARRLNLFRMLDPGWAPTPARVELAASAFSDVEGDGDGAVEPGEVIRLTPVLRNLGETTASGVTISATVTGAHATIVSGGEQALGALESLAQASPSQPVRVAIGSAVPDATEVLLTYTIRWTGGEAQGVQRLVVVRPIPKAMVNVGYAVGALLADRSQDLVYVVDKTTPALQAVSTASGRLVRRTPIASTPFTDSAPGNGSGASQMTTTVDGTTLYLCNTRQKRIHRFRLPALEEIGAWTFAFEPVSIAAAPDGRLYVSTSEYWGSLRQLDGATGAVLASFSHGPGSYYGGALLRLDPGQQRLFATEIGLRTEGGPNYVYEYDVAGIGTPALVRAHPYIQVYCNDFAVDPARRRLFTMNGGIYGVQVTDLDSGSYGIVWPLGSPYGRAISLIPGTDLLFAASGGPYDATVVRYRRSDGLALGKCPLSEGSTYTTVSETLKATANGRALVALNRWRGDGAGYEGYDWRLALVGGGTLVVDNYPRAVATAAPLTGNPGLSVTFNATASSDPDGAPLTWRWDFGDGTSATTAVATHVYPLRGRYTATCTVTDAEGIKDRVSFIVVVNTVPVAQPLAVTVVEDTPTTITLTGSDGDGDALTFAVVTPPSGGTLAGTLPNLVYTPARDRTGSDSFTYRVDDGLATSTATVAITITPVNDVPVATSRSLLTKPGIAIAATLSATDPDSTGLRFVVTVPPANGSLSGTVPALTYTPADGFAGVDSFRFTASDEVGTSAEATISIRVNRPPVAEAASLAFAYNTPQAVTLRATDADGQTLTYRVTVQPTRGHLTGTAPALTYTPRNGEVGADSFAFVANDGFHDSGPASVAIAIRALNPWQEADLAAAPRAGATFFVPIGSGFRVEGAGGLASAGDGGRFTWTTLPEDGLLIARITTLTGTGARGGLMLRAGTTADADAVALLASAGNARLVVRSGGTLSVTDLGALALPAWVRLSRTANGIAAATSTSGSEWTPRAQAAIALPATALGGLWCGSDDGSAAQLVADQALTHHGRALEWRTLGGSPGRSGRVAGRFLGAAFAPRWQVATGSALNPACVGNGLVLATSQTYHQVGWMKAFDLVSGAQRWTWTFTSAASLNPPAFADGRIFVQRGNHSSDTQVWALSAATGTPLWSAAHTAQWERYAAPCPAEGGVFVNGGTFGGMYGFDQVTGSQRFFAGLAQYDRWAPAYADGTLYSWVAGVMRAHAPSTGTTAWSVDCGWSWNGWSMDTVPVVAEGVALGRASDALHAIDLATRTRRWTVSGSFSAAPAIADGVVYALADRYLRTYRLDTGALLASYDAGGTILGQPVIADDIVIVATASAAAVLDRADLAVRQTLPAGGQPLLVGRTLVLAGTAGTLAAFTAPAALPVIEVDPAGQEVIEPASATFAVVAGGAGPLTYRWTRNGAVIPGAVAASYTTPATTLADDGALFACTVANNAGDVTSRAARLTVRMAPPTIVTPPSARTVTEPETATFAVVAAGPGVLAYQWLRDGVAITGATTSTYTTPSTTLADDGVSFACVIRNAGGSTTSSSALLRVQPRPAEGRILREWWSGVGGTSLGALTSHALFPLRPSGFDQPTTFEAPTNWADNYGTRMRGWLHAPLTGDYVFWIAGDDNCELWLSTDDGSAASVRIARVPGWTSPREWTKYSEQRSQPVRLNAGHRYYVEALHKEGGGGDNLAVRWQLPSGAIEAPIPASRLSPAVMTVLPPLVAVQPVDRAVTPPATATFAVTAGGTGPFTYQWLRNGVTIPGATAASYITPPTAAADAGARFSCTISNAVGSSTSQAALLTIAGALPPPWSAADVGGPRFPGSANVAADGTWTVTGGGADIWGTRDGFHGVWQTVSGDVTITARVAAVEHTDGWAKAGVMLRAGPDAHAMHALMAATPGNGLAFQRRTTTGGGSAHTGRSGGAPVWVRLTRVGSTVTGSVSADGQAWTVVGSETIALPATLLVGMAVTAHNDGDLCTATFSEVTVVPSGNG